MKNISVIGSGQMGKGIAQLFASKGFDVLRGDLGIKSGKGFYSYENGRSVGVAELVI
jgi:3-hydroxyacyl-CoA dehydrogenase